MGKNWRGLDFLRGLGIFCLLVMHSAFYYFGGLWDLDLDNPPLIITIIGFLLMFAGLFGMISGLVHGISIYRLRENKNWTLGRIAWKKLVTSAFILVAAYLYFILTGPGLAEFANRHMNNSILVEWIRNGDLTGINLDRLLYVDSLVMIGTNILLVSLIWVGLMRIRQLRPGVLLTLSACLMALSLLRLPLYPVYLDQVARGNWLPALLLNWLVNKNNPILPFLAFGLLGSWLGLRLEKNLSRALPWALGGIVLVFGAILYVISPDTMLERAIDMKWYSIMLIQLGLFILLILASIAVFDRKDAPEAAKAGGEHWLASWLFRFFQRFGTVGLTAFFWESVVAAIVWRVLTLIDPGLELGIGAALLYGFCLAMAWGIALIFWEKAHFVGSIEYFYGLVVGRLGRASSKSAKLKGFPSSENL
jgi:hypothetical protein